MFGLCWKPRGMKCSLTHSDYKLRRFVYLATDYTSLERGLSVLAKVVYINRSSKLLASKYRGIYNQLLRAFPVACNENIFILSCPHQRRTANKIKLIGNAHFFRERLRAHDRALQCYIALRQLVIADKLRLFTRAERTPTVWYAPPSPPSVLCFPIVGLCACVCVCARPRGNYHRQYINTMHAKCDERNLRSEFH